MNCLQIPQGEIGAATSLYDELLRIPPPMDRVWSSRCHREADERTYAIALMGREILSIYENELPGAPPTTAFTSAVRSAQMVPPQETRRDPSLSLSIRRGTGSNAYHKKRFQHSCPLLSFHRR